MTPDERELVEGLDEDVRGEHRESAEALTPALEVNTAHVEADDELEGRGETAERHAPVPRPPGHPQAARADQHAAHPAARSAVSVGGGESGARQQSNQRRRGELPGCEVMIEQVPGQPASGYCGAAHRAAGRRLLAGGDEGRDTGGDEGREARHESAPVKARSSRTSVEAAARHGAGSGAGGGGAQRRVERGARPAPPPVRAGRTWGPEMDELRDPPDPLPSAWSTTREAGLAPSAADLTDDTIIRPQVERPTMGWRGVVYTASAGLVNPGVSEAEAARKGLLRRIGRQLPGAHQIAVSSMKGGVGKTTVAAVLGLTLAEHRGDRVVAVDANPDAGTLADRLTGDIGVTVRQMLDNIERIDSLTAISHYTSLAGRLQVLASEQDPAMSEAFNRDEYEQICGVLARFYNIIITDSGTGLVHSAMEGTLALADSLIVVGAPTVDGASRASKTLDWLIAHGHDERVADAVVVLCCDRVSPDIDRARVRSHFQRRARAVVEVPHDPHLATGARLDLNEMLEPTTHAFLELAALIADGFSA